MNSTEVRLPLAQFFEPSPAQAPACATTLQLAAAQAQFRAEAAHAVCDTGRYRLPYFLWGQGPPLVFVHGLCDNALSFLLMLARLARSFCCVAYDLPTGQGDGARLGSIRHGDLAADLIALLDHLHLDRCHVFGSSFGSTIALAAAHRQPERFERLLLQGGFARRRLGLGELLLASFARYWRGHMRELRLRESILERGHRPAFRHQPEEVWRYFLDHSGAPPIAAVAWRANMLHRLDLRPLLPQIRQHVLLICGDQDPLVDKNCEAELLEGLPKVTRAVIEECGHLPYFTHPEIAAEIVERFLGVKDACDLRRHAEDAVLMNQ